MHDMMVGFLAEEVTGHSFGCGQWVKSVLSVEAVKTEAFAVRTNPVVKTWEVIVWLSLI